MTILLVLLTILSAQAHQVEWVRHSFFGPEQIIIKYDAKKSLLFTNNNALTDANPVRVGFFERKNSSSQVKVIERLVTDSKLFKAPYKILASPHVAKIFLDRNEVPLGSRAYEFLLKNFQSEIRDQSWQFVDGQQAKFTNLKDIAIEDWKSKKYFTHRKRNPASVCKTIGKDVGCVLPSGIFYAPSRFAFKHVK